MRYLHSLALRVFGLLLCLNACSQIAYRHMNDPERDIWQQPKNVIQALHIIEGSHVADLGAGGGYFTFLLAEGVGPNGKVYAVDTDEATAKCMPWIRMKPAFDLSKRKACNEAGCRGRLN